MLKKINENNNKLKIIDTTILYSMFIKYKNLVILFLISIISLMSYGTYSYFQGVEAVQTAYEMIPATGNYLSGLSMHDIGLLGREGNLVNPAYALIDTAIQERDNSRTLMVISMFLSCLYLLLSSAMSFLTKKFIEQENEHKKASEKTKVPKEFSDNVMVYIFIMVGCSFQGWAGIVAAVVVGLLFSTIVFHHYFKIISKSYKNIKTLNLFDDFKKKNGKFKYQELDNYKIEISKESKEIEEKILNNDEDIHTLTILIADKELNEGEMEIADRIMNKYTQKEREREEARLQQQIDESLSPEGIRRRLENKMEESMDIQNS